MTYKHKWQFNAKIEKKNLLKEIVDVHRITTALRWRLTRKRIPNYWPFVRGAIDRSAFKITMIRNNDVLFVEQMVHAPVSLDAMAHIKTLLMMLQPCSVYIQFKTIEDTVAYIYIYIYKTFSHRSFTEDMRIFVWYGNIFHKWDKKNLFHPQSSLESDQFIIIYYMVDQEY